MPFVCGRFEFALDRPLVMGIVNVTPDSFSDGGRFLEPGQAIEHGLRLRAEGADILDIGGESTRPGARLVSLDEELARVLPVLAGLRDCGAALSVDTMKPEVMRAALAAGADMINDVHAAEAPGALAAVAADPRCGLCLMHMRGMPANMQQAPEYADGLRLRQDPGAQSGVVQESAGAGRYSPGTGRGFAQVHARRADRPRAGRSSAAQCAAALLAATRRRGGPGARRAGNRGSLRFVA
jgi:dihydropteroate synthase